MTELAANLTFTALDLETTGLKPVADRIIEIGAVRFNAAGEILATFQTLVDPRIPVSAAARAINGISDAMLSGKPGIETVLPEFVDFLGDSVPVAHHAPFDVAFLSYEIHRLGFRSQTRPVLDTCSMSRRLFRNLPSYRLSSLAEHFGIESDSFHRAAADAEVCRRLFLCCLEKMPPPATLKQLVKKSGHPITLGLWGDIFSGRLAPLKDGFSTEQPITIIYKDSHKNLTERRITPISLTIQKRTPVLEARCHLRNERRTFRLDRIMAVNK